MKKKSVYFVIFSFMFTAILPISVRSQQNQDRVASILQQVKQSQDLIQDLTADITQVKDSVMLIRPSVSKGKMLFKRPNKILVEMYPPNPSVTLLSEGVLWIYFPEDKVAQRYQVAGNPHLAKWLLVFQNPVETMGRRISLEEERKGEVLLALDPAEDLIMFQTIRLSIDTGNWMLKQMELVEKNGDRTTITYHYAEINHGIPDARFELQLPPDVDIIELMKQ